MLPYNRGSKKYQRLVLYGSFAIIIYIAYIHRALIYLDKIMINLTSYIWLFDHYLYYNNKTDITFHFIRR